MPEQVDWELPKGVARELLVLEAVQAFHESQPDAACAAILNSMLTEGYSLVASRWVAREALVRTAINGVPDPGIEN